MFTFLRMVRRISPRFVTDDHLLVVNNIMNLPDRFIQFIRREHLFQSDERLLLAVSGGVDSVVLCELCHQAGYRFVIAHCNFRLREKESERDKEFVIALAKKYEVDVVVKEFDTNEYATINKLSIQEAARELRYDWFYELINASSPGHFPGKAQESVANYVLTAHHADDNIETVLMNFFRGTGIRGLRGMLPKQGNILRPLLEFRKQELKNFAIESQLDWVEDSSNLSDKYSRNYFRKNLIPWIQSIYPDVEDNLLNNLQRFADVELLYQQAVALHKKNLLEKKGNEIHIAVLKLKKAAPLITIIFEIIKVYGFTPAQTHEVARLLESDTGKYIQSSSHTIFKNRNWIIIAPRTPTMAENILIEDAGSPIHFSRGVLYFEKILAQAGAYPKLDNRNELAQLNAEHIRFPILLRKWKPGDYFYPLGMKKKKKLSRFFIDQKLSKTDKENVWVLDMNKKIIWVIGQRIDDRFKVTPSTKSYFKITLEGGKV